MRILVTAGNTQTPIDAVRCLTNVFTGRTGARIAREAHRRGHAVTLLTSHPETVADVPEMEVRQYRTFDDLHAMLAELVPAGGFDAMVHSAAVSDYALSGVYAAPPPLSATDAGAGTSLEFNLEVVPCVGSSPRGPAPLSAPGLEDSTRRTVSPPDGVGGRNLKVELQHVGPAPETGPEAVGKIPSTHPELWMRFVPTPKLVDLVRTPWDFAGLLVKFKLEVGLDDAELLAVAERSRAHSDADLIVANTLESYEHHAWLVDRADSAMRIARVDLPTALLDRLELFFEARVAANR